MYRYFVSAMINREKALGIWDPSNDVVDLSYKIETKKNIINAQIYLRKHFKLKPKQTLALMGFHFIEEVPDHPTETMGRPLDLED